MDPPASTQVVKWVTLTITDHGGYYNDVLILTSALENFDNPEFSLTLLNSFEQNELSNVNKIILEQVSEVQ